MKKIITNLFLVLFVGISYNLSAQNFSVQSGTITVSNIDSCSTTQVDVVTYLGCINWTKGPSSYSVNGTTIDVRVDYTSSFICQGAISYPVFNTTLQNLSPGTYTIDATAFLDNVKGNTVSVGSLTVTSCNVTGVEKQTALNEINFYPNPSNGILFFNQTFTGKTLNYELIDIKGRAVRQGDLNGNKLNFTDVEKGIYFLRIIESGKTSVKKVILK
tara:strand:+ start:432 stop:1079 length:648 start_codon:yes stop_codon:yes gene_type:complete